MSKRQVRTFLERAHEKGYEEGRRKGYAAGLAEGLVESLSDGIAKSLMTVLHEVMAESLLHCLEKGRAEGFRQALRGVARQRFGDDAEDKFKQLTESIDSAETLERMVGAAMWSKNEGDLISRITSVIEEEVARVEVKKHSAPSN